MTRKRPYFFILVAVLLGLSSAISSPKNVSAQAGGPAGGGSGNGGSTLICAETPPKLNLSSQFKVDYVDGKPQVTLNWNMINGEDPHATQKIGVLMDYLKSDPTLGQGNLKMKNAFAYEIYHELSASKNRLVKTKLNEALAQTVQGNEMLKDRHIETLFKDYYPYVFLDQLKNNSVLSEAFSNGVNRSLMGGTLDWKTLLQNTGSSLKKVQGAGVLNEAISCAAQGMSGVSLDRFNPSTRDNIYGTQAAKVSQIVETLKKEGKVQPILEAIKNDRDLIQNTQLTSKVGASHVLNVWAENSNVQMLIKLYETDPNVRQLVDLFFESGVGEKVDHCIKDVYKADLLTITGDVYAQMITPQLQSSSAYNEAQAKVVLDAYQYLLNLSAFKEVQQTAEQVGLSFINDNLVLEQKVKAISGAKAPFSDYYQNHLSHLGEVDGITIDIKRDGNVIQSLNSLSITQFVDSTVPVNESGKMAYHSYSIESHTPCANRQGDTIQVAINPKLEAGTVVNAQADIQIRLRESHSDFFMAKIDALLQALIDNKTQLSNTVTSNNPNADHCNGSRNKLLEDRTTENLFQYVLDCFGDNQINDALRAQVKDFVPALQRFLELNQFSDTDQITKMFVAPLIELARDEYLVRTQILNEIKPLTTQANDLLKVKNINDFSEAQMNALICGGQTACPKTIQALMEKYLWGASHATDLTVEIYDEMGKLLTKKDAHTDIFGRAKAVDLGALKIGANYEFRVKLTNEPYALAKISRVTLVDASPEANSYRSRVTLESMTPFFYGNFDNSDEEINLKDIDAWLKLVSQNPQKWSEQNVDGFNGVDLFDASLFQSNWGQVTETSALTSLEITDQQLAKVYGAKLSADQAGVKTNYAPGWLVTALE